MLGGGAGLEVREGLGAAPKPPPKGSLLLTAGPGLEVREGLGEAPKPPPNGSLFKGCECAGCAC